MTEPVIVTSAGTASASAARTARTTQPTYTSAGTSTARLVPAATTSRTARRRRTSAQRDPVLDWLTSREARRYASHWVALSPESGEFLGLADELPHLRRWQAADALIVFVDPPEA